MQVDPKTLEQLITALGDELLIRETIAVSAVAFGTTEQQAAENFLAGVRNQRGEALEALSDDDVPNEVRQLAAEAALGSGQPVAAIKRAEGAHAVYTTGNPIALEQWFRGRGFRAQAGGPSHCVVWTNRHLEDLS